MRDLRYFEKFLYKNNKSSHYINISDLTGKLDYLSHFIQNDQSSYLAAPVKEAAQSFISDLINTYSIDHSNDLENITSEAPVIYNIFSEFQHPLFNSIANPKFYFIDLFAGIGGFRLACQNNGGKCVFSSEWDLDAKKTYYHNFGEYPFGDITSDRVKNCIPDNFDLLCAGFPCQAFSIAGYRKGFEDTRGTLFFDVATILRSKKPKSFILENVKNLLTHDSGRTFDVIYNTLTELGYKVFYKIMNSMEYANIPQNRERIIIVGFDPEQVVNYKEFSFPDKCKLNRTIHDCIDYNQDDRALYYNENSPYYERLKENMTDPNTIYQWRRQYVRQNKSNVCPTLTANMGTGGHNVPLIITNAGYRKLTPKECLNFQGFPIEYEFPPIAKSKQYKQAGNSVTVPLIELVVKNIINIL